MGRWVCTAFTVALAASLSVGPAVADTFKPTRFDDPPPGKCKPNDCSLREAISRANAHQGGDEVLLAKGRYEIEIPEGPGDDNTGGDFDVIDKVTIAGKGPGRTVVDANGVSTVFSLLTAPPKTLASMTVKGGDTKSAGGGILISPAKTTLRDLSLRKNSAPSGGAIYSVSTDLTISRTTVAGNDAANGGGIYMPAAPLGSPMTVIRSSTVSGNSGEVGAGVYLDGSGADPDPVLEVVNSTVANNQATVSGGGLSAIQGATLQLEHSTVAYNGADVDNADGGNGGGVHQSTDATFTFSSTMITANTVGSSGSGKQCSGAFTGDSGSLIGGADHGCGVTAHFVPDAKIGVLDDNGGPTRTIKVLSGSPAISIAGGCPAHDQRGKPRLETSCDSGAFERKGP